MQLRIFVCHSFKAISGARGITHHNTNKPERSLSFSENKTIFCLPAKCRTLKWCLSLPVWILLVQNNYNLKFGHRKTHKIVIINYSTYQLLLFHFFLPFSKSSETEKGVSLLVFFHQNFDEVIADENIL